MKKQLRFTPTFSLIAFLLTSFPHLNAMECDQPAPMEDPATPLYKSLYPHYEHRTPKTLLEPLRGDLEKEDQLHIALRSPNIEEVINNLHAGFNPNALSKKTKQTPLQVVAACNYINDEECAKMMKLLLLYKAQVNTTAPYPYPPLFYCVQSNRIQSATLLLEEGADPNATNYWEKSLLLQAAYDVHPMMMSLLIQHGAPIDQCDSNGNTVLHCITKGDKGEAEKTCQAIEIALKESKTDMVNRANNDGLTPLHYATHAAQTIKFLISKGARLDVIDKNGLTPLEYFQNCYGSKIPLSSACIFIAHGSPISDSIAKQEWYQNAQMVYNAFKERENRLKKQASSDIKSAEPFDSMALS